MEVDGGGGWGVVVSWFLGGTYNLIVHSNGGSYLYYMNPRVTSSLAKHYMLF